MPRYDPEPYTITKLVGRQAELQRGEKKITRETQKFKRYFTAESDKEIPRQADGEWEDGSPGHQTPKQATSSNDGTPAPVNSSSTHDPTLIETEHSTDGADDVTQTAPNRNTDGADNTPPEHSQHTDPTEPLDTTVRQDITEALPHRSAHNHSAPTRYGLWVTK